jgi:hypothetical protein
VTSPSDPSTTVSLDREALGLDLLGRTRDRRQSHGPVIRAQERPTERLYNRLSVPQQPRQAQTSGQGGSPRLAHTCDETRRHALLALRRSVCRETDRT